MRKGIHTKENVWDEAASIEIFRGGELMEPGVNYFILMLEQMGLRTYFSCEGHPNGFYIAFSASYAQALAISDAGYFTVEVERKNYWILRNTTDYTGAEREKLDAMRWGADAWEERFGPLRFEDLIVSK
jgi:hypothetical protein